MHYPDIKISKSPAARLSWIAPGFEEPSLLPRQKGDIELFQREVEPIASSLHIGFLSGPASKKRVVLSARWERREVQAFTFRKKALGDVIRIEICAYSLHINPKLPAIS
jgi:hypothetical protein